MRKMVKIFLGAAIGVLKSKYYYLIAVGEIDVSDRVKIADSAVQGEMLILVEEIEC